jgi:hypothetical protein
LIPSAAFRGPRDGLDLWHPSGAPRRRLALGDCAGTGDSGDKGPVDVVIVAPSASEVNRAWLERAIAMAAHRLDRGGVLWIIVPRRWRGRAERALRRDGLVLLDAVFAIPRWPHSAHLVPMAPVAFRDAGPRHLGLSRNVAWLLGSLLGVGAVRRLLRRVVPSCALLAAHEPELPTFRWLGDLDGAGVATATVSCGPRSDARVAVALRFRPQMQAPDIVVKAALDDGGTARVHAERAALELLGTTAAAAGAAVPALKTCRYPWMLVADALEGRSAAAVLAGAPGRLVPVAGAVAEWLLRWNAATATRVPATAELLERVLVAPVGRLAAAGVASEPYARAMTALAARLGGRRLLVVALHGDLTMANVLPATRVPGIVDWESATAAGLPLVDLWYALTDGVARAGRIAHASAVEALVTNSAPAPPALTRLPARHAAALRLTADETILAFHVCWLGHADTELRRGGRDHRFNSVVRTISALRLLWP